MINFNNIFKKNNNISEDDIIKILRNKLINNSLDSLINAFIEKEKKDLIYTKDKIIFQLTSSFNQKNNVYHNISSIDLGKCENLLRLYYNINDNITLLILKIDFYEDGLSIPIIEYDIYNSKTKEKLNLNICKDTKIKIYIPVSIDENNLFKYNSSHEYYNDICYPYTTEDKTDIILQDRREEYINKNLSLCEKNCEFKNFDFSNEKVECYCSVKNIFHSISDISNNKDKLWNDFINITNIMNINIMKCYKVLFTQKGLINNIGSYIIISIIFIEIILVVIFKIKGFNKIKLIINYFVKMYEKNKILKQNNQKVKIYKKNNKNQKNNKKIKKSKKINKLIVDYNSKSEMNDFKSPNNSNKKINNNNLIIYNNDELTEKKDTNNNNQFLFYNDYELNNLSYEEALEKDKRTYLEYYFSLLKMKQLLIFTFYTYTDYNSKTIKISLFLFSFILNYTINALFFDDFTIHKIYIDKGDYNFIYQIAQIFYSSIISSIISIIIKSLSLSEKKIAEIKREKNNIKEKEKKLVKCLLIKFIIFYILIFLFLIFFWYYISCFGIIYKNTQMHLLKDTFVGFGLSLLFPFGTNLVPGIFRIISLSSQKKDLYCMYKISKIIQII